MFCYVDGKHFYAAEAFMNWIGEEDDHQQFTLSAASYTLPICSEWFEAILQIHGRWEYRHVGDSLKGK